MVCIIFFIIELIIQVKKEDAPLNICNDNINITKCLLYPVLDMIILSPSKPETFLYLLALENIILCTFCYYYDIFQKLKYKTFKLMLLGVPKELFKYLDV